MTDKHAPIVPGWALRLAGAALATALTIPAWAQTQPPKAPNYTVLEPQAFTGRAGGKAIGAEGIATSEGVLYSVQDLDLMQPVAVGVLAQDPQRAVILEVVKGEWTKVLRRCETSPNGQCDARFRTQGNFGLRVTPKNGSKAGYQLFLWVGKEVQAVPNNLFVPRRK